MRVTGKNNRSHPLNTHGQCERVTRERAGGERGFPRDGVAARGEKAECTRAIRPRVKRLPYPIRRPLNAGRANVKNNMGAIFLADAAKGVRGKAPGRFPAGREATLGKVSGRKPPGRSAAEPRRKAPI